MRINFVQGLSFKRQLRDREKADFTNTILKSKEKLGNTGHSMLIIPSVSMPDTMGFGVGNLLNKETDDFINFAKQHWGINCVQTLPEGEYRIKNSHWFLPYGGSTLDLGVQVINLEQLTTNEYADLLTLEDIKRVSSSSNRSNYINFENIIAKNSPNEKVLRKAFEELSKSDNSQKQELLKKIKSFSMENKDWLESKGIFEALSVNFKTRDIEKWDEISKNLYNTDIVSIEKRNEIITNLKKGELNKEVNFYEFKQFLAQEHLAKAKRRLNTKGIKLSGDIAVGFSLDEVWANPKAFVPNHTVGWNLPLLNFDNIEAEKLLCQKVRNSAKRYDALRIDAAWTYVSQPIINKTTKHKTIREHGEKLLNLIEGEIKKVKGINYKNEDIMYEFVTDSKNFQLFEHNQLNDSVKNRMKICTSYNLSDAWGTSSAFNKRNWGNNYILGTTNHDSVPLKKEFQDLKTAQSQIKTLSEILKIPKEKLQSCKEFINAKFAEPMRSKHNMIFFTEALNLDGQYKDNLDRAQDYRIRVPKNYKKHYFSSLEKNEGFNIMDALEKSFLAEGFDKKEPELFKKIQKYKKILQSPERNKKLLFTSILVSLLGFGILIISQICLKNKRVEKSTPTIFHT